MHQCLSETRPTRAKSRKSIFTFFIVIATIVLFAGIIEIGIGYRQSLPAKSTVAMPTVVRQSVIALPSAKSFNATLGAFLSNFIRAYGEPVVKTPNDGVYSFERNEISLYAFGRDKQRVSDILYTNNDHDGWDDPKQALADCHAFLPQDAITAPGGGFVGTEYPYFSNALAPLFESNYFTDEYGNQTYRGITSIAYHTGISKTHIANCEVQVGAEITR